jgi:hypothetical protein
MHPVPRERRHPEFEILSRRNARLRKRLAKERVLRQVLEERLARAFKIPEENILWIFGTGRTGSTWFSSMMEEMPGHEVWFEPMVGELFDPERLQVGVRPGPSFIFSKPYREQWLDSIKAFVLECASAHFPEGADILVVKEPHGSAGAPMLSEALPTSRFVLLVRDPRDAVASALGRYLEGPWQGGGGWGMYRGPETTPEGFVERAAYSYRRHVMAAKLAYGTHRGPKSLVRYEDLRADVLSEMRRLYYELGIEYTDADLVHAVEKHAVQNLGTGERGRGQVLRKANVGSWEEDLTPAQARLVEEVTAPVLEAFYGG